MIRNTFCWSNMYQNVFEFKKTYFLIFHEKFFSTIKYRYFLSSLKCLRAHIGLGPPKKVIVPYAVGNIRWNFNFSSEFEFLLS